MGSNSEDQDEIAHLGRTAGKDKQKVEILCRMEIISCNTSKYITDHPYFMVSKLDGRLYQLIKRLVHLFSYVNRPYQLSTVVPTMSDSDVIFCLQLLPEILTCSLHFN